ncbi:MAG: hypothetical protein QG602_1385, partial [Verrucomicrobiota bacterium]|nr:hypothetical protein [Verrucomicrobiota bacterium]
CALLAAPLSAAGKRQVYTDGPNPVLFHASGEQLPKLFPVGTPRAAIHARFGQPWETDASTRTEIFGYSMLSMQMTGRRASVDATRIVRAHVTFDENDRVAKVTPSTFEHWVRTEKGVVIEDRAPTPQEIAEHLQPLDPAKIEALIAAGYPADTP